MQVKGKLRPSSDSDNVYIEFTPPKSTQLAAQGESNIRPTLQ